MTAKKALLIIDMQKGSFTQATPRYNTEGVIQIINSLSEAFRLNSWPVLFIQHDGRAENNYIPYTTEWEILDDLHRDSSDIFIDKNANDVFYNSELQKKLTLLHIQELVITGCATDFCVESTVQSALSKDYHITVIEDGHTTSDRPHLLARQVINHYNWVWKNMLPTQGIIQVITHQLMLQECLKEEKL